MRLPSGPRFWCLAYLVLCAPVCIALALIVPPGEVADEGAHLARAAALIQGDMVGHRESVRYSDGSTHLAAGVRIDPVWDRIGRSRPKDFGGAISAVESEPDARGRIFVPLYTVGTYPPFLYLPGAAGLGIARVLGLAPEVGFYLGRLGNATATLAIALAALALAHRGRVALFAVLALPMTLSLAASFNQDAPIIALAALAAALLTPRPLTGAGARWRLSGAILSLALVVLAKPPYAGLAAMLLVPLPPGASGCATPPGASRRRSSPCCPPSSGRRRRRPMSRRPCPAPPTRPGRSGPAPARRPSPPPIRRRRRRSCWKNPPGSPPCRAISSARSST